MKRKAKFGHHKNFPKLFSSHNNRTDQINSTQPYEYTQQQYNYEQPIHGQMNQNMRTQQQNMISSQQVTDNYHHNNTMGLHAGHGNTSPVNYMQQQQVQQPQQFTQDTNASTSRRQNANTNQNANINVDRITHTNTPPLNITQVTREKSKSAHNTPKLGSTHNTHTLNHHQNNKEMVRNYSNSHNQTQQHSNPYNDMPVEVNASLLKSSNQFPSLRNMDDNLGGLGGV